MKAAVAYKTLDNITVVLLAFKNFKNALSNEFMQVNGMMPTGNDSKYSIYFFTYNAFFRQYRSSEQGKWSCK